VERAVADAFLQDVEAGVIVSRRCPSCIGLSGMRDGDEDTCQQSSLTVSQHETCSGEGFYQSKWACK
jgi:hypothetical protein